METGFISGKPGALDFHATEGPHRHRAIRLAAPRTTPMLQLHQLLGRFVNEVFDGILIAQPVAATHGIAKVQIKAVVGFDDASGPAFRRAGMAAHRVDLGDQGDAKLRIGLRKCDSGAQPRSSRTDDCDVSLDYLHYIRSSIVSVLK